MSGANALNQSDKLRYTPIGRLLLGMSLPAMLSMLAQALYNIVDSVFVAFYSDKAFEALSIVFPLQMLVIAFATGFGVGTNAVVAKKLGEGKKEAASLAAQTGLLFNLISAAAFMLVGIFAAKPFMASFTNNPETLAYGTEYLFFVLIGVGFIFVEIMLSSVLQAAGNMKVPMLAQLAGTLINVILDPIMIFGLIGFPRMGIKGAAIATVIGEAGACLVVVLAFLLREREVKPFFQKGFRLNKEISAAILRISIPTIILKGITSVTVSFVNTILKSFENAIIVLGIYIKLQSFVFMPVFGLTQGALPILSYNYGAGDKKRYTKTFKLALVLSFAIMAVGVIVFQAMPELLLKIFKANAVIAGMGVPALRIISLCFVCAAFTIIIITMLQSLGMGVSALILSLMRQLLLLMPLAYLLPLTLGVNGVWWAYPIAEVVTTAAALPMALYAIKKRFAARSGVLKPD